MRFKQKPIRIIIIKLVKEIMEDIPKLPNPHLSLSLLYGESSSLLEKIYNDLAEHSKVVISELDANHIDNAITELRIMYKISKSLNMKEKKFEIAELIMIANKLFELDCEFNDDYYDDEDWDDDEEED